MSEFHIVVRRNDGQEVKLRPGGYSERNFIHTIIKRLQEKGVGSPVTRIVVDRAKKRGVGFFVNEKRALLAIENAVHETFMEANIVKSIEDTIHEAFLELKSDVQP